jgi:hypothetical protein
MTLTSFLLFALLLALCSNGRAEPLEQHNSSALLRVCNQIAGVISDVSRVYFPRKRVILLLLRLQSDLRSSYTSVFVRHFTCCFFKFRGIRLLSGARIRGGCEQDCGYPAIDQTYQLSPTLFS